MVYRTGTLEVTVSNTLILLSNFHLAFLFFSSVYFRLLEFIYFRLGLGLGSGLVLLVFQFHDQDFVFFKITTVDCCSKCYMDCYKWHRPFTTGKISATATLDIVFIYGLLGGSEH